jgi:ATP-binding cassette subfamily B protein
VPQVPHLISASIEENILLGEAGLTPELHRAISTAQLTADLDTLPGRLDTRIGARGARLSGGQASRVATARALIRKPEMLVLDDISSALDAETEHALWGGLLSRQVTALVASNRPTIIGRADQVIVMTSGSATVRKQQPQGAAALTS